jgi:hypothetical protein
VRALRILFVGNVEQTTAARRDAFLELGQSLHVVDERAYLPRHPLHTRLDALTLITPRVLAFNRAILEGVRSFTPDVVWIEKGIYVFPRTIRSLKRLSGCILVYHNTDDWRGRHWRHRLDWRYLLRALPLYDVHVTSNLHNVREFREAGFPRVHHMELAANPAMRDPASISEDERTRLGGAVGFIGHWEPATEKLMLHLLRNSIPLKIYGGGWERARERNALASACQHRYVWGEEYARAVLAFDINLGIVSTANRSHTATRTFQIPALGGFLLHQRNEVVRGYYEEGVEAEFFASPNELLQKCRHYLGHPEARKRIAEAGRRRCRESRYFETDRVREVLPLLELALAERT